MVELLSPAGTYEGFLAALSAGADAVYAGGQCFSARAYAGNLSDAELLSAIDTVHVLGKKLYLTLNTLCKEREFKDIYDYLAPLYERGLDGVIVQDIGIIGYIKREFPELPVHASTQMSISGIDGINCMRDLGVCRVVPARELTLDEIRNIRNMTDMELECFIHGAMCYSYSGQCLFSGFLGGRSGNRGRCAQPCRLPYSSIDRNGYYPLSMKDMCTLNMLPLLIEAGITSFKIEGRMKKSEYTYTVTGLYRKYIDLYYAGDFDTNVKEFKKDYELLTRQYVRGEAGTGYYYKRNGRDLISLTSSSYNADSEITGVINNKDNDKNGFKIADPSLPVDMNAYFKVGEPVVLVLSCGDDMVSVTGGICQMAQKAPLDVERIKKQLSKTGGTLFSPGDIRVEITGDVFIPMGELNELRRRGCEALYGKKASARFRKVIPSSFGDKSGPVFDGDKSGPAVGSYTLCFEKPDQLEAALGEKRSGLFKRIYVEAHLWDKVCDGLLKDRKETEVFAALPYIIRDGYRDEIIRLIERINSQPHAEGVLVRNYEGLKLCLDHLDSKKKVVADAGLYSFNREAVRALREMGIKVMTLPLELNIHELKERGISETDELLYYGRMNMMLSANCVDKTGGHCHKDKGTRVSYLTDRHKERLPVISQCEYCYNRILNPKPLSLFSEKEAIQRAGIKYLRFHFTTESKEETARILDAAVSGNEAVFREYTKGHFRKSVE